MIPLRETRAILYGALMTLALAGASCSPEAKEPAGTQITDDLGRTILVAEPPQRILSLAPSTTELAFAAGLGDRLVGVTDADDYPPEIEGLARLSALPLNHEAVVALEPDLILASDQINDPRDAAALQAVGIPTFFVSVRSLPDVSRAVRALGFQFGAETQAAAYADSLERTLRALDIRREDVVTTPTVIFLIGDETLFSFGPESYVHDMIRVAGGRSLTADMDTEAPILSEEFVLAQAPDVLLTAFDGGAEHLLALHPAWASVPAIFNGRVYRIAPDLVLRAGPRLIEGTRLMASVLQPTQ